MQRHFKITVAGHAYDVTVEEVTDDSGNLYPDRETMRGTTTQAPPATTAAPPQAASDSPPAAGPDDVASPIAGVVVSIDVEVGASVEADTRVATLEAMKTKTIVAAGRAGTVSAIAASSGQSVAAGQALLTIS